MTDAIDLIDKRLADLAGIEFEIKILKEQRAILVAANCAAAKAKWAATPDAGETMPAIANSATDMTVDAPSPEPKPKTERVPRRTGLKDCVVKFLEAGTGPAKPGEIAGALDAEVGSVQMALTRLKKDGVVINENGYWRLVKAAPAADDNYPEISDSSTDAQTSDFNDGGEEILDAEFAS